MTPYGKNKDFVSPKKSVKMIGSKKYSKPDGVNEIPKMKEAH
jgi:hypothetical protein